MGKREVKEMNGKFVRLMCVICIFRSANRRVLCTAIFMWLFYDMCVFSESEMRNIDTHQCVCVSLWVRETKSVRFIRKNCTYNLCLPLWNDTLWMTKDILHRRGKTITTVTGTAAAAPVWMNPRCCTHLHIVAYKQERWDTERESGMLCNCA